MIVSTHKFVVHGILHSTISYVRLFLCNSVAYADYVWFSLFFSSKFFFFQIFYQNYL